MGGRVFIDKATGINPASRIPTEVIQQLSVEVRSMIYPLVDNIEEVTSREILQKIDHGDLDFVCLDTDRKNGGRQKVRDVCAKAGIKTVANGPMEHLLFPLQIDKPPREQKYQVDLIFCGDYKKYKAMRYFYSRPITFNAVVGNFARSIGYKFSTEGLLLHVTDKRKQNYFHLLTREIDKMIDILGLSPITDEKLFSSPEIFADWIMDSPRFDTKLFIGRNNKNSHRDAKSSDFCARVYEIIENSNIKAGLPPSIIDFTKPEFDLEKALKLEKTILGEQIYEETLRECERRSKIAEPVIRGDILLQMGFQPGPILGKIIQDVSDHFEKGAPVEDIIAYVHKNYKEEMD